MLWLFVGLFIFALFAGFVLSLDLLVSENQPAGVLPLSPRHRGEVIPCEVELLLNVPARPWRYAYVT